MSAYPSAFDEDPSDYDAGAINSVGAHLQRARNLLAAAMQQAEGTAISASMEGMPETQIARALGVNRMTVRKWLGKL